MSLIHKALKKAEGGGSTNVPADPEEAFVGGGGGFFSAQFTPRTLILLVVALGALAFTVYQKVLRKPKATPPIPVGAALNPPSTPPSTAEPTTVIVPAHAGDSDRLAAVAAGSGSSVKSAATLSPEVAALMEEGKALFTTGQFDAALGKFVAAAEAAPKAAVVWNNIGLVRKRKQDLAAAEDAYLKAIDLQSDYPECLNNIGVLKAAQGDPLSATLYLKKALTIDPTYADAHFNLGVVMEQEGNWRSAIQAYKAFLQYTTSTDKAFTEQVERRIEELSE